MKQTVKTALTGLLLALAAAAQAADAPWQAIGRAATADEVKAWDIDVRGDFKGLPKGQGSVARGEQVWEGKCASCHGSFGESNEVFTPLIGGTTAADIVSGRTAALAHGGVAQRTTIMKVARLSTVWDYVNRAMPWNAPKSLATDEVYAVVAYMLNLAAVVPADFTLSDANIAAVQEKLPNRNGLKRVDGLWDTRGKPDVFNTACMKNCGASPAVSSFLPDFARNAHGNIAEQNRPLGAVRGSDTSKPAPAAPAGAFKPAAVPGAAGPAGAAGATKPAAVPNAAKAGAGAPDAQALLTKNGCTACHSVTAKLLGPSLRAVAAKYQGKAGLEAYLAGKIKQGGSGLWGAMPMPPQTQLSDGDAKAIAQWLAAGAQ